VNCAKCNVDSEYVISFISKKHFSFLYDPLKMCIYQDIAGSSDLGIAAALCSTLAPH